MHMAEATHKVHFTVSNALTTGALKSANEDGEKSKCPTMTRNYLENPQNLTLNLYYLRVGGKVKRSFLA